MTFHPHPQSTLPAHHSQAANDLFTKIISTGAATHPRHHGHPHARQHPSHAHSHPTIHHLHPHYHLPKDVEEQRF